MTGWRRRLLFPLLAIAIAAGSLSAVLLAVDVYLHGRYQTSAGFNVWGYRGSSVGKKAPREFRIVMLGGSAAYGYGVTADQAIPAQLQQMLRKRSPSPEFTVVNLGYNNEGAYSFKPTLQDYRWLDYDLAFLYEGYNDLGEHPNMQVFRHESPVFRLTGYLPIFPMIFHEKAAAMMSGGDAGAAYRQNPKTVFQANLATRTGAGVLDATAAVARSLEAQLGKVAVEPVHRIDDSLPADCAGRWIAYCRSVVSAIEYARAGGSAVLIGTQPYLSVSPEVRDAHMSQQAELRAMLSRRYAGDPLVGHVDLGNRVDLADPHLSFDHMHLRTLGNATIAASLVEPVLEMARRRAEHR